MFPISHWSITNNDWDRIGIGSLEEQNSSLHNQINVNYESKGKMPQNQKGKRAEFKISSRKT